MVWAIFFAGTFVAFVAVFLPALRAGVLALTVVFLGALTTGRAGIVFLTVVSNLPVAALGATRVTLTACTFAGANLRHMPFAICAGVDAQGPFQEWHLP